MIDPQAVIDSLIGILESDAVLVELGQAGAYDTQAPQNATGAATTNHTIVALQGGVPTHTQQEEASILLRILIKHVVRSNYGTTGGRMAARVKTRLNRQAIPVAGALGVNCRWAAPVRYTESGQGGVAYQHTGAIYEVTVDSL